jgi:DNA-binding MarR family transcriptional regulator
VSSFDPQRRQTNVAAEVTMKLYRVSQAVKLLLREKSQAHGLSATQLQALLFLAYARPQAHTIGGLAERLGCTAATASGVVNALERKGLASREPQPEERRSVMVTLSDDGMARAAQVEDSLEEIELLVDQLPAQDQAALLQLVGFVEHGLVERGRIKAYGMCWNCRFFRPDAYSNDPLGPHHCIINGIPVNEVNSRKECPDFGSKEEIIE